MFLTMPQCHMRAINMATSPLPSRGLMVGRNQYGYIPAFSGPHGGEKSIWLHHPFLLGVSILGSNQPKKEWMWWK